MVAADIFQGEGRMANVDLSIDQLDLNLKNPRFDGLANQRDAIEKIVVSQGRKLVNLAEDITARGLSPAHRMLATAGSEAGQYVVLDGNRRLTALRVLVNPAVLDGMNQIGDVTKRQLKKLATEFDRGTVEPIDVYVCENDQEARHWVEGIHTGENEGRGVVNWDGIQTARFRGQSLSLKILGLVAARGELTDSQKASLQRFPITNLDRLLSTREVRDLLGLVFEEGELLSDVPLPELIKPLKKIVMDIASKNVRVSHIERQDDRISYVKGLGKGVLPNLSKRSGKLVTVESLIGGSAAAAAASGVRHRSQMARKTLIPADPRLHVTSPKLEEIYKELRKLPLETYPNAIGTLARVFIELSTDHYGTARVKPFDINWDLKKKMAVVADHLQTSGVHKRDLQPFRRLISSQDAALSIDRLHGIVHSRYHLPTPSELRRGWDEIGHIFEKCFWGPPPAKPTAKP